MASLISSSAVPTLDFQPYKSLENEELTERVQAVRAAMGPRLLILGHHYQQDEVIALTDLRGDSYQLGRWPPRTRSAGRSPFAASTSWPKRPTSWPTGPSGWPQRGGERVAGGPARHGRRLLAGRHGRHRAGRRLLGATGRSDRHRRRDADHLRQFGGQLEGVLRPARRHRLHVGQRPGGARLGLRPPQPRAVLPRPAPGPQHGPGDGHSAGTDAALGSAARPAGRQHARGDPPQPRDPVARALQRPPDVPAAARRPVPRRNIPASRSSSIPSA